MFDGFMWTLGAILAISVVALGVSALLFFVHAVSAIWLQWRHFKEWGYFDQHVTFFWTLTIWQALRRDKAAK